MLVVGEKLAGERIQLFVVLPVGYNTLLFDKNHLVTEIRVANNQFNQKFGFAVESIFKQSNACIEIRNFE
jgi:hypothetical protein